MTPAVPWRFINRLSYSMFFHVEHHLFPAVPAWLDPALHEVLAA